MTQNLIVTSLEGRAIPYADGETDLSQSTQLTARDMQELRLHPVSAAFIPWAAGDGTATVDMGAYEAKGYFNLHVVKAGSGLGTVTSTPPGIDCGDVCSQYMQESTNLTLKAAPVGFSKFTGWSGACTGDNDCTLNFQSDTHITATFEAELKVDLPVIFR